MKKISDYTIKQLKTKLKKSPDNLKLDIRIELKKRNEFLRCIYNLV